MYNKIITISRQYGSGGRTVAKLLADELKIPYYDNELISLSAAKSGIGEEQFLHAEERAGNNFLYALSRLGPESELYGVPLTERIFDVQSKVVKDLANNGPCVIVGRCADYVLRDYQNCINIFTYAPLQTRISRAVTEYGLKRETAQKEVRRVDKSREAYYNYHTGGVWGNSDNYDLMINMNHLSPQAAVKFIISYLNLRSDDELRKPFK